MYTNEEVKEKLNNHLTNPSRKTLLEALESLKNNFNTIKLKKVFRKKLGFLCRVLLKLVMN